MDKNTLVKVMLDYCHKDYAGTSQNESKSAIRNALIEANGGETVITKKSFRKYPELYEIVEEFIENVIKETVEQSNFFKTICDQKNIKEGDEPQFTVEKGNTYIVADAARGVRGIRRQRATDRTEVTLKPVVKAIRVYEELTRVLAGKTDITELADKVAKAVADKQMEDVYTAIFGVTRATLGADFCPTAGAYSEDALFDLANLVSAANGGANVILVGTMKGARKAKATDNSEQSKLDVYNHGYALKWNGYDFNALPQRLKAGTNTFAFDDNKIFVIPLVDDKFVKQVVSGDVELVIGDTTDNADATIDISVITAWATAIVTAGTKIGVYEMA